MGFDRGLGFSRPELGSAAAAAFVSLMMAGVTSDTAAAGIFAASGTSAKPRGSASECPRVVAAGGRRRCRVVHCDAGGDAHAVAKPASIPALEQFKISAHRESLSPSSDFASPSPDSLGSEGYAGLLVRELGDLYGIPWSLRELA
ncbi:hypothetical protein QYE76_052169 [Lolium multiflorum]|uniref:Uncharacterized protein n=1 Tax=Lolium multiflorum TaxID=4521 RepID=A0AAD8SU62_LOLMU|nr:hypothetical protein QYE76_052169 [Lolium multiflorum]